MCTFTKCHCCCYYRDGTRHRPYLRPPRRTALSSSDTSSFPILTAQFFALTMAFRQALLNDGLCHMSSSGPAPTMAAASFSRHRLAGVMYRRLQNTDNNAGKGSALDTAFAPASVRDRAARTLGRATNEGSCKSALVDEVHRPRIGAHDVAKKRGHERGQACQPP